jgi:hypothetical protein
VPVTLLYEPQDTPHGTLREAAVHATAEEALFQAAWDALVGQNRDPLAIVDGAHHGSPGWKTPTRPKYHGEERNAHDQDAEAVLDLKAVLPEAIKIVREHWVVDHRDAADTNAPAFGTPRVPPGALGEPSPSVEATFAGLRGLL